MSTTLNQTRRPAHLAVVTPEVSVKAPISYPMNVIACWSGTGSPGRSTIALNLATELALAGERVLLIDLDTLSPSLPIAFGLVDTPAGLSAMLRLAEQGRLSYQEYQRLTVQISLGRNELSLLTGLASPKRWTEVSVERFEKLLHSISGFVDHVVLDLPLSTGAISSNPHPSIVNKDELLDSILTKAAKLILISGSDPISAKRFVESCEHLHDIQSALEPIVVVNRFRNGALGPNAKAELSEIYEQLVKLRIDCFIPDEPENLDKCLRNGLPLALLKRSSPARKAITELAKMVTLTSRKALSVAKLS
jgi:MinD-like ATPase involved in chromosome partitioning or flagellar assembly